MVLLGRIELPTSSLPMTRSTTELQQLVCIGLSNPPSRGALLSGPERNVKHGLQFFRTRGIFANMSKFPNDPSREERLAAKLRENLRRRKTQARDSEMTDRIEGAKNGLCALPNSSPES